MKTKLTYYKERYWLYRICKACGVKYIAPKESNVFKMGRCWPHRKELMKELYQKNSEYQKKNKYKYKVITYTVWKKWVNDNLGRRRDIALKSYHRKKMKPENKARKHRATRKLI